MSIRLLSVTHFWSLKCKSNEEYLSETWYGMTNSGYVLHHINEWDEIYVKKELKPDGRLVK